MLIRKQSSGLPALTAALLLSLGATGCNTHASESAALPLLPATPGQGNGSLTSSLPTPRDLHHQLHIRTTGHVVAVSFRHSFHPAH